MKFTPMALAASFVVAPAAFTASLAQSAAVSEKSFDWIFFAIVGIPFIIALVSLFRTDMFDRFVKEWPWEGRRAGWDTHEEKIVELPDQTSAP